MHSSRKLVCSPGILLSTLLTLSGCQRSYTVPESPMPPNTILLSQMMRQLSAQPGFTEMLLQQIEGTGAHRQQVKSPGPALMTPRLIDELRKRILGKDWQGLDRFPGWTMREINPTVRGISDVAGHIATTGKKVEDSTAAHTGPLATTAQVSTYLDLGPYPLDKAGTASLEIDHLHSPTNIDAISLLGNGVVHGDSVNQTYVVGADSKRLADVLNRLAANKLEATATFQVKSPFLSMMDEGLLLPKRDGPPVVYKMISAYKTPEDLITSLQATGHTVTVDDDRYFANFLHLHYGPHGYVAQAEDVMAPFWIDSQLIIPNSGGRHLLIPASHAELEWHVRGPLLNAEIAYYFGIDGKAEWRTMDTLDQPWVLRRAAHTYTGAQAVEVTRLAGLLTVAYLHAHAAHPALPFGGYYALGVCQDGVSAIERAMTGRVTLFPNTVDTAYFNDPRDAEVNALLRAVPNDRDGTAPDPERIFGSLPAEPGPDEAFAAVTIPGLADDLHATYAAWQSGRSLRPHGRLFSFGIGVVVAMLVLLLYRRRTNP